MSNQLKREDDEFEIPVDQRSKKFRIWAPSIQTNGFAENFFEWKKIWKILKEIFSQAEVFIEYLDLRPNSGQLTASISIVESGAECDHFYSNFPYDVAKCCGGVEFHSYGNENFDQKQRTGRLPIALRSLILPDQPANPSTNSEWKITKQVPRTIFALVFLQFWKFHSFSANK